MKKSDWLMAVVIVALLLGSFPVRALWSETACDIMRLTGAVLLIKYVFQKITARSDDENA